MREAIKVLLAILITCTMIALTILSQNPYE